MPAIFFYYQKVLTAIALISRSILTARKKLANHKGFGSSLFLKKACRVKGQRPLSSPAGDESPNRLRSARGEFQNSPVDCFERGDDL